MEQVARRWVTLTAAALTAGGLVVALAPVMESLPDVQIRDFDLAASLQNNPQPQIDTIENHIRPDLVGTGDVDQSHVGLGDLLFGRDYGTLNGFTDPTSATSELTLDQNLLSSLLGAGFDPEALRDGLLLSPNLSDPADLNGITPTSGLFGGNDQGAANAGAAFVTSIAQALPAAQQALYAGIAAAELEFNNALTSAQATAVEQLGGGSNVTEAANWIFTANNTMLVHDEVGLNNLLGLNLDTASIQNSLLAEFDPGGAAAQTDWNSLLTALTPADFNDIIAALQADNVSLLLGSMDWSSLFPGVF
ncbi:MAG: hypothetical protein ABI307_02875 [Mycobacterium sp.]